MPNTTRPEVASSNSVLDMDFFNRLREFSRLLGKYHVNIEPLSELGVSTFRQMSVPEKRAIAEPFFQYADLVTAAANSGIDLNDEKSLLLFVLPKLGLSASKDTIDLIGEGDILEIYNADHIQIFRNIEFMKYCNYTLIDLVTFPFFELYERSPYVTNKLIDASRRIFTTDLERVNLEDEFPHHALRESFSSTRAQFVLAMKYFCALYSGPGTRGGLLTIIRLVDVLGEHEEAESKLAFI